MQFKRTAGALLFALTVLTTAACDQAGITAPSGQPSFVDTQCPPGEVCWAPYEPEFTYGSRMEKSQSWQLLGSTMRSFKAWTWSAVEKPSIASGRVDAVSYSFWKCRSGERALHKRDSRIVYGVGRAEVYIRFDFDYVPEMGFQIIGTHTFVPAAGYYGGGTFTSESSQCTQGAFGEFPA